jgi:hypothetical protein
MPRLIALFLVVLLAENALCNQLVDALQKPSNSAPISGVFYEIAMQCEAGTQFLAALRSREESAFFDDTENTMRSKESFNSQFEVGRQQGQTLWNSAKFQRDAKAVTCKTVRALASGTFRANPAGITKPSHETYNALWNDSGPAGSIGFWLYKTQGTCPTLREKSPRVIAAAPIEEIAGNSADSVLASSLGHCFLVGGQESLMECTGGSLSYTYVPEFHEYVGTYLLKFADGSSQASEFSAQYCPATN